MGSSRRYIASNFTEVIVNTHNNTMSNMSGMQKSAANKLLQKKYTYAHEKNAFIGEYIVSNILPGIS